MFVVIETTPGYLPDTEPERFDSYGAAKMYANDLIEELVDAGYNFDSDYIGKNSHDQIVHYIAYFSDPEKIHDLGRMVEVVGVVDKV